MERPAGTLCSGRVGRSHEARFSVGAKVELKLRPTQNQRRGAKHRDFDIFGLKDLSDAKFYRGNYQKLEVESLPRPTDSRRHRRVAGANYSSLPSSPSLWT